MFSRNVDCVRWWVAFLDCDQDAEWRWWHLFTRKGFRHVLAFCKDEDHWIIVDPTSSMLHLRRIPDIYYWNRGYLDLPEAMGEVATAVVMVDSIPQKGYVPHFLPYTCVSVVKSLLGMRAPCFTPYGLYRHLIRHGGEDGR